MKDIDSCELEELVDIRDVKIDRTLPKEERIKTFLAQIKNPYCFRVGDVKVHVSYADNTRTLDDNFSSLIASM